MKLAFGLVFAGEEHYKVSLGFYGDLRERPFERVVSVIAQEAARKRHRAV